MSAGIRIIEHLEDDELGKEGCLSFPGLWLDVYRSTRILVEYENTEHQVIRREFSGLMSRAFQHELDHLNGKVFVNHVSKLRLRLASRRRH